MWILSNCSVLSGITIFTLHLLSNHSALGPLVDEVGAGSINKILVFQGWTVEFDPQRPNKNAQYGGRCLESLGNRDRRIAGAHQLSSVS